MKNLKITLVQSKLFWEDRDANLRMFQEKLSALKKSSTDLIILPEMFSTGFTMNAKVVAETMDGDAVNFMKEIAAVKKTVICGSVVIREKNKFYNRLLWVKSDKSVSFYDKRHLFRMADEHKTYSSGTEKLHVDINGWKICPLVCYDLRFPVWSRSNGEVDLMIYVANWPTRRRFAWQQLLIARSIENQSYVAGVNRVGIDGNEIDYSGDSIVLDPMGEKLSSFKPGKESVETIQLDYTSLSAYRKRFPVFMDADKFKIVK